MNNTLARNIAPIMQTKLELTYAQTIQALMTYTKMRNPFDVIHAMVCKNIMARTPTGEEIKLPTVDGVTAAWNNGLIWASTLNNISSSDHAEILAVSPDLDAFSRKHSSKKVK